MAMRSRSGFPFAKTVMVLAIIFGIALGMCGLNYALLMGLGTMRGGTSKMIQVVGPVVGVLGFIELAAMVITGPLLVLTVIAWVISEAIGAGRGSEPQTLLGDAGEKDDSDGR